MCRFVFAALVAVLTAGCGKPPTASEEAPSFGEKPGSAQPRTEYVFAVYPLHNPAKLFEVYQPLVDRINEHATGIVVKLESSKDYADFEHKLATRAPHFALQNPYQTVRAEAHGYRIFGKMGDDERFRGVILVRADSGIKKVNELRGAAICFPAPTAVAACMMPKLFLKQQGLDAELEAKVNYVGSQESSIVNVVQGLAKAGCTWPSPWDAFQREKPELAAQLVVQWETAPLVNNGLVVRDDVPAPVLEAVSRVIFHLQDGEPGRRILGRMSLSRYEPATSETYEPMRKFLAEYEETLGRPPVAKGEL